MVKKARCAMLDRAERCSPTSDARRRYKRLVRYVKRRLHEFETECKTKDDRVNAAIWPCSFARAVKCKLIELHRVMPDNASVIYLYKQLFGTDIVSSAEIQDEDDAYR